jgi:hypothetical protein
MVWESAAAGAGRVMEGERLTGCWRAAGLSLLGQWRIAKADAIAFIARARFQV